MKIESTELKDAFIITPDCFGDSRGWFMETYSKVKLFPSKALFFCTIS